MHYLKREINKVFPLALLSGAIGGILLIALCNTIGTQRPYLLMVYLLVTAVAVFILNHVRYRKDLIGSLLCGGMVYLVMTFIAYIDKVMNVTPDFTNPLFEGLGFNFLVLFLVLFLSAFLTLLFIRRVFS